MNTDYDSLLQTEKEVVDSSLQKIAVKFCRNPNETI